MRRYRWFLIVIGSGIILAGAAGFAAQDTWDRKTTIPERTAVDPMEPLDVDPPRAVRNARGEPEVADEVIVPAARGSQKPRSPEVMDSLEQAAAVLRQARPVPDERWQVFADVLGPGSGLTGEGWQVVVESVAWEPETGTSRITVLARPRLLRAGSIARVFGASREVYDWDGESLHLIDCQSVGSPSSFGW